MAYQEALEAAGATVHEFKEFGDYEGSWWAKVTLPDGRNGWLSGSYGSCSGCDAYEAELGYEEDKCDEHHYTYDQNLVCENCDKEKAKWKDKLIRFGEGYFETFQTQDEAEQEAAKDKSWDMEADKVIDFIRGVK